jgi:haloalkane dehalogenase
MSALADVFPRRRTIRIGEVDTHVTEGGEGPPILLLHGNPDTHTVWSAVVSRLGGYRCIAPDLPGYGKSVAPRDHDCSLDNQAAWTKGLLDALELDKVHLVVHDVGGPHGFAFASKHPERLKSLTIFNTNFFPDYRWHFWARVWRTRVLGEIAMAVSNRWLFVKELKRGGPRMPVDYARHAYGEFKWSTKRNVLRWYRYMDPEVHEGWDKRLLAAIANTPRQVLWGDCDPFLPKSIGDRYGGTVHHVADCGHWVMVEDPDRAATLIRELVAANT